MSAWIRIAILTFSESFPIENRPINKIIEWDWSAAYVYKVIRNSSCIRDEIRIWNATATGKVVKGEILLHQIICATYLRRREEMRSVSLYECSKEPLKRIGEACFQRQIVSDWENIYSRDIYSLYYSFSSGRAIVFSAVSYFPVATLTLIKLFSTKDNRVEYKVTSLVSPAQTSFFIIIEVKIVLED